VNEVTIKSQVMIRNFIRE